MSSRTGPSSPGRPAALLAVRIGPADVGRRVTVRRRVEDGLLSDVVGVLERWSDDGVLEIRRRTDEAVEVPARDMVAAKVVAPELSAEAMQRVAEAGWPPSESAPLGEWVMRATHGVTSRANSVRVQGDPGMPLADALDAVTAWYSQRGLAPLLQLPDPSVWTAELERRGWASGRRTTLRTAATAALVAGAPAVPDDVLVGRERDPDDDLLAFIEPTLDPALLGPILRAPAERVFITLRGGDGSLLAAGRASSTSSPTGPWAGITSIATAPSARRRGLATALMGELARWAEEVGCPSTYLQVMAANAPAIALYERLGFALHHTYEYRSPQPVPDR